ncbi:MAG: thermostable hemolysin [Gammaproteobacteria bacterium]|nr:thermostable hemolysin [Gammaproteobacteria bacterium]MBU2057202.1 thermostable hemolysin [Gammaproteobacteria bacterium]MBU2174947.1 thermostable hemolysin [Gammaproteobacteria bacterium]MBU2246290.1 thermostable hemolysin [Gammaproteobacteria bacterium]MBU2344420.1 thermostable hemolysin [Gammaproteobacteria bacterium]
MLSSYQFDPSVAVTVSVPDTKAQLQLVKASDMQRVSIEQFIASGFAKAYQADVHKFMPNLLGVSRAGEWQAVLGLRCAAQTDLFIEHYLPAPVEQLLATYGMQAERSQLIEIGHLYASNRQSLLQLFVLMAYALDQLNYRYLLCAATSVVRGILSRHGIELTELGEAKAEALGEEAASWGSYYDTNPKVCVMDLAAVTRLIHSDEKLTALAHQHWPQLHQLVARLPKGDC